MKKYAIYLRKSTDDPNHQLYSLAAQGKLCSEYAEKNKIFITDVIEEKHSAKEAGKRPLFAKLIEDLKSKKYDGVITHKVDRLLRNIGDYAKIDELRSKGIEFIFVDGSYPNNPDGNMMLGINVVFAKRYVENLSLEVKKGYREALDQGRFPRESAIGYLDKGRGIKEVDPCFAPLVRECFDLYDSGNHSLNSLVKLMREKGLRTKKGQKYGNLISRSSLHRILQNTFYYGDMYYNGIVRSGIHEPIISRELFDRVQKRLNRKNVSVKSNKVFAFRGLIRCHECNGLLSPYSKKGHTYYSCTSKKGERVTIKEGLIDDEIANVINKLSFTKEELSKAKEALSEIDNKINGERNQKLKILNTKESQLISALDRIRELVIKGVLLEEEYLNEKNRHQTELQKVRVEKDALINVDQKRAEEIYDFLELSKNAPAYFKLGEPEEKRELVKIIFLELNIQGKKMSNYKLYPEFEVLEKRHLVLNGGTDGTRTRDLLRDRQAF